MEDSKIIELLFARSEMAITGLSEKYGNTCHKIASNILKNEFDAEECVNDTYLGVWNTVPPENPNPLVAYVCRIVRNLAIKKYHRNTAKKRNSFYDVSLDELEGCLVSAENVEDAIDAAELSDLINTFLEGIGKKDRIMFVRRYWFSDSVSDIAARFAMSNHAVTVRLSRIREKLRRYLVGKGVTV